MSKKNPLFLIYKEEGIIKTESTDDLNDFELYGFLKLFVRRMEKILEGGIEDREDKYFVGEEKK